MPRAAALAARCGFPLSPQLHRGIPASGPALPGAAQPSGTASMLDPSRPELEFRIHLPPAGSLQTFGSSRLHLTSRSTLRIFRADAIAQWQDAVAAA